MPVGGHGLGDHLEQRPVGGLQLTDRCEQLSQCLEWVLDEFGGVEQLGDGVDALFEKGVEDFLRVGEVPVDGADSDAGATRTTAAFALFQPKCPC